MSPVEILRDYKFSILALIYNLSYGYRNLKNRDSKTSKYLNKFKNMVTIYELRHRQPNTEVVINFIDKY